MGRDQIDTRALQQAVTAVGPQFQTKDISEQPELQRAHPGLTNHDSWHSFVGGALSDHRGLLGIESAGQGNGRGRRWRKRHAELAEATGGVVRASAPVAPPGEAAELGPQYAGDDAFTARMRRHQSWWRAHVLRVPAGTGPIASATSRYGNMLPAEAGAAGLNFLTPEIFAVARGRAGSQGVEPFRLMHNMLSSQPMCFNLLGPLVGQGQRAGRLIGALLGEPVREVEVTLEWAPQPASDYLADRTACDAFILYRRGDGGLSALCIETKLTESFSPTVYDGEAYRRWMRGAPFRADAHDTVATSPFNQLWRNHLLALALRERDGYAAVRSVVVHHPLDTRAQATVAEYRGLLTSEETFGSWTLAAVVEAFRGVALSAEQTWLDAFQRRYLDMEESAALVASPR